MHWNVSEGRTKAGVHAPDPGQNKLIDVDPAISSYQTEKTQDLVREKALDSVQQSKEHMLQKGEAPHHREYLYLDLTVVQNIHPSDTTHP